LDISRLHLGHQNGLEWKLQESLPSKYCMTLIIEKLRNQGYQKARDYEELGLELKIMTHKKCYKS